MKSINKWINYESSHGYYIDWMNITESKIQIIKKIERILSLSNEEDILSKFNFNIHSQLEFQQETFEWIQITSIYISEEWEKKLRKIFCYILFKKKLQEKINERFDCHRLIKFIKRSHHLNAYIWSLQEPKWNLEVQNLLQQLEDYFLNLWAEKDTSTESLYNEYHKAKQKYKNHINGLVELVEFNKILSIWYFQATFLYWKSQIQNAKIQDIYVHAKKDAESISLNLKIKSKHSIPNKASKNYSKSYIKYLQGICLLIIALTWWSVWYILSTKFTEEIYAKDTPDTSLDQLEKEIYEHIHMWFSSSNNLVEAHHKIYFSIKALLVKNNFLTYNVIFNYNRNTYFLYLKKNWKIIKSFEERIPKHLTWEKK